ncbi:putative ATP-dependent RNA helicase TDRD12 isoform X3 [Bombus pyrosoma]|uniref:putative ATP-dependent RNA helicase TDRD12 isoform X3 n=1 Tax=Bombus pyrosoma TaxID=396416 RepID=UPI001CB94233|nr:putative ATP-dependent RNA helicase TDRD12 isoform X3 [Bombus pyrosoma]
MDCVKCLLQKGAMLPSTATVIKITNILTPYIVRIYEVKDYNEKLNSINKKLLKEEKTFHSIEKDIEPKIGDTVIVYNRLDITTDCPGWLCRGYISSIENLKDTYNIFLPDYGISIKSQREDFIVCSTGAILEEYLTFTVGLYNILPADVKHNLSVQNETLTILEEWSTSAIEYTKELISASDIIYFDHIVSDQYGKYYGEFYLNIKNKIICLSEALVLHQYAIYLNKKLLQFIEYSMNSEKLNKEIINDETTFYLNVSQVLDRAGERTKQKESFLKRAKFKRDNYLHHELQRDEEKVLIYGMDKYEWLSSTLDVKFPVEIHKAWKSLIQSCKPRKIQSYIWPAIKKGLDTVAIGTAKCGKTIGYTFAICGLLATNSSLPRGINPSALILCSSSSEVLEVHFLCTKFLEDYKAIKSVAAINGKSERSLVAEMFNGCQILISTPRFLIRFMNKNKKLVNFKNLRYLILDDGDIILDKYFDSISQLFRRHNIICNRELKSKTFQIIITATYWTLHLKKIASILMENPCIYIASFMEAAIFKSIRLNFYVINSREKHERLLDSLGNEYSTSRTIVICTNNNEAKELNNFLEKHKETLLAHGNMNYVHLQRIKQYWNVCTSGSYPILICTDDILPDIDITNVTWLIHYSIPLHSKTQFNFRFSTLLENLQMENSTGKVTIIMDENNDRQFLHIIKIMQRTNYVIPEKILESVKFITATLEQKKENYPICDSIKSWGFCNKQISCALRHKIISKVDAPITDIQINDKVKFRVVSIHDATHVSARIISYIKFNTLKEVEFSTIEYLRINTRIQEFYSCVENRKKCETLDVGCICGLEEPVDAFKRIQILHIERENKTEIPKYVNVRCIDNGVILKKVDVYRLLHMPQELIEYSMQVVEVFLVGIAPHDEEYVWNNCAIDAVYQWFKENVDDRSYVIGTVNLHLGNTIWVNTLNVGTKLIGYKDLIGSCLRTELLEKDHAVEDDKHLNRMYQLCRDAGFLNINGYDLNL